MPHAFISRRNKRFDRYESAEQMASRKPTRQRSDYPLLDGADTVVVLSSHRHFKLHSVTLKQCSNLFAKLLSKESAVVHVPIRYCIVLQNLDKHKGEEILPVFRRVDLDAHGRPTKAISVVHESEESSIDPKLYDYYDKLLGSFFNVDITIDTSSVPAALQDALGLISAAEYLDSIPHIAKTVDHALVSMGQSLYQAIAASPVVWMDLASRIYSKPIFREAMAHVAGRYPKYSSIETTNDEQSKAGPCDLEKLKAPVRELVEVKAAELQKMCQHIDQQLVTYYPAGLYRQSTSNRADRDDIGRSSYATDIFAWMALTLFRHYVGFAIASGDSYQRSDGGYAFYKLIQEGGMAYLDRQAVASFHDRFPMSSKGKTVFFNHLEQIKEAVKEYVQPLLKKNIALDTDRYPIAWLACTRVEHDEFPWVKIDVARRVTISQVTANQILIGKSTTEKVKGKQNQAPEKKSSGNDNDEFDEQNDFDLHAEEGYLDARYDMVTDSGGSTKKH